MAKKRQSKFLADMNGAKVGSQDIEYKTISVYGRRLFWSKKINAYSARVVSSHINSMRFYPDTNVIEVTFHNGATYKYNFVGDLFDVFARVVSGSELGSIGKSFWSIIRRNTTEYGQSINYGEAN